VRARLGEDAELLGRDSRALGRARAAVALLAGGLQPGDVAAAVRRTRARVVHAHNVHPAFGWRALAAARAAGARVVLHLHNYRLVCAVGTCFNGRGEDCTLCRGRDTRPGVRLNCRGTGPEAAAYGAALALWQRRLVEQADAVVVPSAAAAIRLRTLRAPLDAVAVHVVPHVVRTFARRSDAAAGAHCLVAGRIAREKGVDVAVAAAGEHDAGFIQLNVLRAAQHSLDA
jgi:glycosyltransferase involved in cell wall biosynthesis